MKALSDKNKCETKQKALQGEIYEFKGKNTHRGRFGNEPNAP